MNLQRRYLGFQFYEYESASVNQCEAYFMRKAEALAWAAEPTGQAGGYREVLDTFTMKKVEK